MVSKFNCECGNTNPNEVMEYDGCLGFEALICKRCGRYCDCLKTYPADDWSRAMVNLPVESCNKSK